MENQPLVTIYTITRNRADLLPRAMKSILSQTYKNIEYLIIDSASTDNTEDVVKSFHDDRIRYIKLEENKTFGACVNMAFDLATGKYVSELDDDDEYHLDKIEKQVALFETLPDDYGMVYCWMTYFDNVTKEKLKEQKATFKGNVYKDSVEAPLVSGTPTLLIRRSLFHLIGGYKESQEIGIESDWEFAARITKFSKVDFVPESLVNVYENHGHQRMSVSGYYRDFWIRNIKFHEYMLNSFRDVFEEFPSKAQFHLYMLVRSYCMIGQLGKASSLYLKLLRSKPTLKNILSLFYSFYQRIKYGTKD